ncbi:MAG: hypothetical protein FJ115_03445 [Deltaproteobacteria bacterium]|nr:hypothetical protein [Deltaproteobacteria bacterium]MBM4322592.1 hypothetical protein [Deltaproteobacteria bacterium]
MSTKPKMPHPEHEIHLCFLENIGYLRSPELLEIGVDRREEYKRLVRGAKFICKKCGRAAAKKKNLCEPETL